jgi:hypothetical protein
LWDKKHMAGFSFPPGPGLYASACFLGYSFPPLLSAGKKDWRSWQEGEMNNTLENMRSALARWLA